MGVCLQFVCMSPSLLSPIASSPALVGRAAQLNFLASVLERVASGNGATVLITGEAGIGKSRLARETQTLAAQQGYVFLRGRCFEQERALPYAPLIDLWNNANFQDVSHLTYDDLSLPPPSTLPSDSTQDKHRRLLALHQRVTAQLPALMLIEDLHWCDDASLEFLLYLARRIERQALLLLLTYRSDEISPSLNGFLATLERERRAREIRLEPLTEFQVAEMVHAILKPTRPLRTEFLKTLYEWSEGNPFFVEEILNVLTADEVTTQTLTRAQIPRTLQHTVERRLKQLPAHSQTLVKLAAVMGKRFDVALLKKMTGLSEDELKAALDAALAAQLIVEESADEFSFRHALTRQAVYNAMLLRERQPLHRAVAFAIENSDASADTARSGELAFHFFAAGEWDKAYGYALRAGERAAEQYAPRAAIEHFTRALDAAHKVEAHGLDLGAVYHARAHAFEILGEFESARLDYLQALDLARANDARRDEWQALLALGFLWAARDASSTQTYLEQALYVARELNEPATLARTLNRVGNWHAISLDAERAHALHREALQLYESLDDARGRAETFDLLGIASLIGGDFVTSVNYLERAIDLWRALNDLRGLVSTLTTLAMSNASYTGDVMVTPPKRLQEKLRVAQEAQRFAREIEYRAGEALACLALAIAWGGMGEYGRAFAEAQRGLELAADIEHRQNMTLAQWTLGVLYLDVFALEQARTSLEQALENAYVSAPNWVPLTLRRLVNVLILQNDWERAEGLLNAYLSPEQPARAPGERGVWTARAEFALAQGDSKAAREIAARLVTEAAQFETYGIAAMPRVALLYGEALTASRRKKEAAQFLDAAIETARARGLNALLWRALIARGKLFQMTARSDAARELFAEAREWIQQLAAALDDDALRANFLLAANARVPHSRAPTAEDAARKRFGGLSARERQIATRIARGESNRAIADALVLSQRTVESHVTNILTKLGLTSRAQIAAWAVARGLL